MSSFEYKGKNVDKAVKLACEELNLTRDELKYEILSYGSSGIFGLTGAKKARILVRLPEKDIETKPEPEPVGADSGACEDTLTPEDSVTAAVGFDEQPAREFSDSALSLGREVLQRIVESLTADAKISAEADPERICLSVTGGNAGILIGKKGQTLEAIQSLVEKIVNKHGGHNNGDKIRVQVDVEGYLENRKANLEQLARRLAEKSKRIRKPISLGQMSAYDRRIVHMALKDHPDVRTKSRGEGYLRKLVIFPKILKNH
jgi:spoIIIJ-associated protein